MQTFFFFFFTNKNCPVKIYDSHTLHVKKVEYNIIVHKNTKLFSRFMCAYFTPAQYPYYDTSVLISKSTYCYRACS